MKVLFNDEVTEPRPLPPRSPRCPVCRSHHKTAIHALRVSGMTYGNIEIETRRLGTPIKRETIAKHFHTCLKDVMPEFDDNVAQQIADGAKSASTQAEVDFATLVQKRATDLLRAGELRVTATHGLQAQSLLDRRMEKQADRDLALNMARLLSGAIYMPPMNVIEGRVVGPPALADGLAPDDVVDA